MLGEIGIGSDAQRVYLALLREPELGETGRARDLAREAGVGGPALGGYLDELEAAALIDRDADVVFPRDPKLAIAALVRGRQEALEGVLQRSAELARQLTESMLRGDPRCLAQVVDGERAVVAAMLDLVGSATSDVAVLDAPPYVDHVASERAENSLFDRGVRSRAIYASAALEMRYEAIAAAIRGGEVARALPDVPIKLIVVDGERALLPLAVHDGRIRSVIVVHPSLLASALSALFESLWEQAAPLAVDATPEGASDLDELDRALLALLGSGLKDEAIARQLDISLRTLGRRSTRLLERLGASSRFQAGVQAAR